MKVPSTSSPPHDGGLCRSCLRALAVSSLLILCALGTAGEPSLDRLEHLSQRDGLSHRFVLSLHQDRQGFLWIGTQVGLNRYDGYEFKVYRHRLEDPDSLIDDYITAIDEDPDGDLWIGTFEGISRLQRHQDRFVSYRHDPEDPTSPGAGGVYDLEVDSRGTLWVATESGLDRYDPESDAFTHLRHDPEDPRSLSAGPLGEILEGSSESFWVLGHDGVLNRLDRDSGRVERIDLTGAGAERPFLSLTEDDLGHLWIASEETGLLRFEPETGELEHYPAGTDDPTLLPKASINDVVYFRDRLWVASEEFGVSLLDPVTRTWSHHRPDPDRPGTLSDDRVLTFLEDRTGVLWIGTDSGLDKYVPARERFTHLRHRPGDPNSLSSSTVWPVLEDRAGLLWVGTYGQGLNRLDRQTGTNTVYRHDPRDPNSLPSDHLTSLFEDSGGRLWIATAEGLGLMDEERTLRRFEPLLETPDSGFSGWIYHIEEAEDGTLWLGGSGALWHLDPATRKLRALRHDPDDANSLQPGTIYAMDQDASGRLWLGSSSGGLSLFDPLTEIFVHYRHDPTSSNSLSSDRVASVLVDSEGVWIGTGGDGLNRLDFESGEFRHFRTGDGLPSGHVHDILEDGQGQLWLSTTHGLSRFDPAAETFRNYDVEDGLQGNAFYIATAHRSPSGELFFAGPYGITAFYPERLIDDAMPPKVAITDFLLFNRSTPLSERWVEERQQGEIPHLQLSHRDVVVGFEFAALHFVNPGQNRYAYRLEGVDPDWVETDARKRFAQYTNLEPGSYLFQVKASQQDDVWNEEGTKLRLSVLPPPWKTWWAYSLYTLALTSMLVGFIWTQRRKIARERAINEQLRKVDKLKDEFLANTSHELRTPLYGIIGIAESMIDGANGSLPKPATTNLSMIAQSGKRLSKLVEDMLDFSKLSRERLALNRRALDLRSMVDVVLTLSRPLVGSKNLRLINAIPADLPPALADEDRLQQILYNLIGNAIKFTDSGAVEVSASLSDDERLEVQVSDSGIGIAADSHEKIFGSFEQLDASAERLYAGTGLGLALTRELVQLHGGSIWVESEPGEGSTFTFTLPTTRAATQTAEALDSATVDELDQTGQVKIFEPGSATDVAQPLQIAETGDSTRGRILVVDDEPVNRLVLASQLGAVHYSTTEASSGFEALRLLEDSEFDLVLLDIMMPRMSGFEVCQRIREQHPIEKLPVIFLTAKNQVEDRVTGFSSGANDYLTKPVAKSELLARVETHLNIRDINRRLDETVAKRTDQLKTLGGLLPICGLCKRIRDDQGYWNQLETFLDQHSDATLTHGLCPECIRSHYAEYAADLEV